MTLPNKLFFTGVPGSKWSSISQVLELLPNTNTSDHKDTRVYSHKTFSGHRGVYFGRGMEFDSVLDNDYINSAWSESNGMKIVKSHDWAYKLDLIEKDFKNDWIMLVYRPDLVSYNWWHTAGGFDIEYPAYHSYKNSKNMLKEIQQQNQNILEWAVQKNLSWHPFTPAWVENTFDTYIDFKNKYNDILVSVFKPT